LFAKSELFETHGHARSMFLMGGEKESWLEVISHGCLEVDPDHSASLPRAALLSLFLRAAYLWNYEWCEFATQLIAEGAPPIAQLNDKDTGRTMNASLVHSAALEGDDVGDLPFSPVLFVGLCILCHRYEPITADLSVSCRRLGPAADDSDIRSNVPDTDFKELDNFKKLRLIVEMVITLQLRSAPSRLEYIDGIEAVVKRLVGQHPSARSHCMLHLPVDLLKFLSSMKSVFILEPAESSYSPTLFLSEGGHEERSTHRFISDMFAGIAGESGDVHRSGALEGKYSNRSRSPDWKRAKKTRRQESLNCKVIILESKGEDTGHSIPEMKPTGADSSPPSLLLSSPPLSRTNEVNNKSSRSGRAKRSTLSTAMKDRFMKDVFGDESALLVFYNLLLVWRELHGSDLSSVEVPIDFNVTSGRDLVPLGRWVACAVSLSREEHEASPSFATPAVRFLRSQVMSWLQPGGGETPACAPLFPAEASIRLWSIELVPGLQLTAFHDTPDHGTKIFTSYTTYLYK